ncbi:hypothetical protein GCM10007323_05260 [Lactobacillus apis]|nr:hypothetical protein GCM10007323_05260 [Lactobacillus apis]
MLEWCFKNADQALETNGPAEINIITVVNASIVQLPPGNIQPVNGWIIISTSIGKESTNEIQKRVVIFIY